MSRRTAADARQLRRGRNPARAPVPAAAASQAAALGSSGATYLPGIDGLRAIAVLAVLLYHGGAGWLPGGFLGVEVFFVISGFLITRLLLGEAAGERIDLVRFWVRRARRLLPALAVLLAATSIYAAAFVSGEAAGLRDDVLGALAYATNWVLIYRQESYFEAIGRPSLLQHLWSLAVEEQFYLLWPLVVAAVLVGAGRRTLAVVAIAGAVASAALMWVLFDPAADPSRVYYGTDTRAAGLLAGAALATVLSGRGGALRVPAVLLTALAALAAGVLAWSFATRAEFDPGLYRGGFAVVDLATVVLLAAVVLPGAGLAVRMLGCRPMRWVGLRSYSLYLWHWPVFMLTRPHADVPFDGLTLWGLRFALSFALAEISYRWVELPVRRGALRRWWRSLAAPGVWRPLRPAALAATAVAGLAGAATFALVTASPAVAPEYLAVESVKLSFPAPASTATGLTQVATNAAPDLSLAFDHDLFTAVSAEVSNASAEVAGAIEAVVTATPEPEPEQSAPLPAAAPEPEAPAPPPPPPPPPRPGVRVTAIGDSVMLGAAWALGSALGDVEVDAAVSRQGGDGVALVRELAAGGLLGSVVVIHLGTNSSLTAGHVDAIMAAAGERLVVFVNVRVPRSWEETVNGVIAAGVARHGNARLADWHAASAGHPEWFRDDGVHLEADGQAAYAALIAGIVNR